MQKLTLVFIFLLSFFTPRSQSVPRPKLVVGIVVDQMRWDYLYRYYDRYSATGGFKRLISQGFSCDNTFIPYAPTVTACGHATIYTGSVPAINGITGNFWYDNIAGKTVYCTEDTLVTTVGSNTSAGMQSPRNLFVNTIGDELRLASNFKGKVVGVALKDRGSILPAGHSANAAYWYDPITGDWITSSFYMTDLPKWVKDLNARKLPDEYYRQGWKTLYPIDTYVQSTPDENNYEGKPYGADAKKFPYDFAKFAGTNYGVLTSTPYGNSFTMEMAKAAVNNEQLGSDAITDLLAVSLSSTDYVGHAFGPNSIEAEDIFLRLDKEMGDFLDFLDTKVGKDQYTVFLSADHGAAHVPQFVKDHKMPGGVVNPDNLINNLNAVLKDKFNKTGLVLDISNYQVQLNTRLLESASKMQEVKDFIIGYIVKQPGIARAFDMAAVQTTPLEPTIRKMINNGYFPSRCGQIQLIFQPQYIEGFLTGGTTHGLWNPYDSHIPLIFYGWGIKQGKTNRTTYMTDITATLAAMLHIQMPNGCVGEVITEVMK
ncbi:MAG: alkaline phosphatase family protein [Chitinophagaceae bacterium]|nr:alkaline phosphatase family protein [Chitinophagaceae bacterium]